MTRCFNLGPRFVGDPVDVVTGEVWDVAQDFRIDGNRPFVWERYYQSFRAAKENHGIGAGHRHGLDWSLRIGLDGLRLETPIERLRFAHVRVDGESVTKDGWRLTRVSGLVYQLRRSNEPVREFTRIEPKRKELRLHRLLHADGGQTELHYRGNDRRELQSVRDTQQWALYFEWQDGLLVSILARTATGESTPMRYAYDERRRLRAGHDGYNHSFYWTYDDGGRVIRRTDRRGYSFVYAYDQRGRCIRVAGEDDVDAVRVEYFPAKNETKVTHETNGAMSWYRYLPTGGLTEIEDAHGGKRVFLRDETGLLHAQVDATGYVWKVVHDALGAVTGLRDPLGYSHPPTENPNEPEHDPLRPEIPATVLEQEHGSRHPLGFSVPRENAIAQAFSERIASGLIARDRAGSEAEVRDAAGLLLRTEKQFGNGRVLRRRFVYDAVGNIQKIRDYDGGVWLHTYASWNQRTSTKDPLDHVTHFVTGKRDKLVQVRDPNRVTTEYDWDRCDRLAAVRRLGKVRERYVRDLAGALVEKRGPNDDVLVRYLRGPLGTLRRRACKHAEETFVRDDRGRIIEAKRTTATSTNMIRRAYDPFGRCTLDSRDGAGVWQQLGSLDGRLVFRPRASDEAGLGPVFVVDYRYFDGGDRLEITDPTGRKHEVRLVLRGIVERRFAHGLVETSQYDGEGQCISRINDSPRGLWRRRFVRNSVGDVHYREDERRGRTRFIQDLAHRLTEVHHPDDRVEHYEHDGGGNLLHQPGLTEGLVPDSMARSASDLVGQPQLAQAPGNRLYRANGDRFDYDHRDHVCARSGLAGKTEYVRDDIGRMLAIVARNHAGEVETTLENEHDALGRRVRKRWQRVGEADRVTEFFWERDRLAGEVLPDGRLRLYIYEDIDALVPVLAVEYDHIEAKSEDGRVYVLQADHRGAIEHVEDTAGNVVWDANVGPYGEATITTGAGFHQPFRLVGQYYDEETGLSGHRYRNWSPELGRFLESDPIGLAGGLNLYAWPGNPMRHSDPLGLGCPGAEPSAARGVDEEKPPSLKVRRISPKIAELAASPGSTADHLRARKVVAKMFYKQYGQKFDINLPPPAGAPAGKMGNFRKLTTAEARSEIKGIDFAQPLHFGPPPQIPKRQNSWQVPGGYQGQYYADARFEPTDLGIHHSGNPPKDKVTVLPKVPTEYEMNQATPYLESTSSPVGDFWSISGQTHPTRGGGIQRYVPFATQNGTAVPVGTP